MFDKKILNKITRKYKKFKLRENHFWEDEFEEKITFIYMTYEMTQTSYVHFMIIGIELNDTIELEIICDKGTEETDTIKESLYSILEESILKNKELEGKSITKEIDRERLKKYFMENERLRKRLENIRKK